ncbi:MAG: hypothetical protein Q4E50_06490 [Tissierellia bacterium]|nr:hypothetical protein [Tissierellia bacterium]
MKKALSILLLLALILTGCNATETKTLDEKNKLSEAGENLEIKNLEEAVIISRDDNQVLVYKKGAKGSLYVCDIKDAKIYIDDKEATSADLLAGMKVKIDFSGPIEESYPAQIGLDKVYASSLVKNQVNDKIGFYTRLIDKLIKADEALISETKYLGLDLEKGPIKLNDQEQEALAYHLANKYDKEILFTNFESLEEEDRIKDLAWEDGFLVSVESDKQEENPGSVEFKAQLWRSGLGAVGFKNCKASWDQDGQLEEIECENNWIS